MFATIRKYKVTSPDEVTRIINEGFIPIISKAPGFVAYNGIDAGNGEWVSTSFFNSEKEADASNHLAADFVKQHLQPLIVAGPEVTTGKLVAKTW